MHGIIDECVKVSQQYDFFHECGVLCSLILYYKWCIQLVRKIRKIRKMRKIFFIRLGECSSVRKRTKPTVCTEKSDMTLWHAWEQSDRPGNQEYWQLLHFLISLVSKCLVEQLSDEQLSSEQLSYNQVTHVVWKCFLHKLMETAILWKKIYKSNLPNVMRWSACSMAFVPMTIAQRPLPLRISLLGSSLYYQP